MHGFIVVCSEGFWARTGWSDRLDKAVVYPDRATAKAKAGQLAGSYAVAPITYFPIHVDDIARLVRNPTR